MEIAKKAAVTTDDKRTCTDRRRGPSSFHYPERRTGFDRRRTYPVLGTLRASSWALLAVLVLINVLSLADWLFTMNALSLGATEGNPVLAGLLGSSPYLAGAFKLGMTLLVSIGIWMGRRYRLVLVTALVGAAAYVLLIAYHLAGLAAIGAL